LNTLCSGFNIYGNTILKAFINPERLSSIAATHGTANAEERIADNVEVAQAVDTVASGGVLVANAAQHPIPVSDPMQDGSSHSRDTAEPANEITEPSDVALPLDDQASVAILAHEAIVATADTTQTSTQAPDAAQLSQSHTSAALRANKEMEQQPEPSDLLLALQSQFALINMTGKIWVLDKALLNDTSGDGTAQKLVLSSRSDGTLLLTRLAQAKRPHDNPKNDIKAFFCSPGTTCYSGVEFNPAGTTGNRLNLWVGPTIVAVAGNWTLIKEFILNVICNGDQSCYDYLMAYIAHALQRPWEKPGVIILLIGGQGIGKGTLGRILRMIWQATFLQVHNVATVTGNFNADLERTFIVFMDEALFVGDRRASDALKSLVTEQVININEEHQPSRQINSYHRFFIATNAEHVKQTDQSSKAC